MQNLATLPNCLSSVFNNKKEARVESESAHIYLNKAMLQNQIQYKHCCLGICTTIVLQINRILSLQMIKYIYDINNTQTKQPDLLFYIFLRRQF